VKRFEIVPIEKIHVGERHRQDMGDLEELAQSIRELGLLQPIGINKFFELVFGERRFDACHILNWTEIPCAILDFDEILLGEYTENTMRKDFTASERVAIAKSIEDELGKNRPQGRPAKESKQNIAEFPKGKQTREIAAVKAGFGNATTYEQAADVVADGAPELVAAMDSEEISISAADVIVQTTPKEKQATVVAMPKDQRKQVVKDARKKLAEQQEAAAKNEAYSLRRHVEELSKCTFPPESLWSIAGEFAWTTEFTEHLERAIRFLLGLKEGHPNARQKLRSVHNRH
jgi:hypothetical protein